MVKEFEDGGDNTIELRDLLHSEKEKYFRAPFLVLQVVTNRGLYSVPEGQMVSGATMIGIWGPDGLI